MSGKSHWVWVSLGLLCLLIVAAYLAIYYYNESAYFKRLYEKASADLERLISDLRGMSTELENLLARVKILEKLTMKVNILIDYGNGTQVWYNNTMVPREASVLTATKTIASVEGTVYPEMGTFVESINGVRNEGNRYWIWYIWNPEKKNWEWGPVASDKYILQENDTIMWRYEKF
ncbi:MAG: DUF4430 domain-containing protein [Candidatus Bathyarchaeia archaeon]